MTGEAVRVLETVSKLTGLQLEITQKPFGGAAIDATGVPLPDDTLQSCKEADAVLLGESWVLDPFRNLMIGKGWLHCKAFCA